MRGLVALVGLVALLSACTASHRAAAGVSPRSQTSTTALADVNFVVGYGVELVDGGPTPDAVAQAAGATDCLAWRIGPLSLGPGGTYEVHLRIAPSRESEASTAISTMTIIAPTFTAQPLSTFSTDPAPDVFGTSPRPQTCRATPPDASH